MTTPTLLSADPALAEFADLVGLDDPVAAQGGRTRWKAAGRIDSEVRIVDAPAGIVAINPAEMTVTVRAGTTVAELNGVLAEQGQRTALPERSIAHRRGTVGGAIAVGENHIAMSARGRLRDSILQLRYVSSDAKLITAGGPTVKNVTGFDLCRLHVGAHGTLGLIGEAIIRTNPIPDVSQWFALLDVNPDVVRRSLYRPAAVIWDGTITWVKLEGHERDVVAQHSVLAGQTATVTTTDGPPTLPPHRWSLTPAQLTQLTTESGTGPFVAVMGTGLAFREHPQPPRPLPDPVVEVTRRLKRLFDPTGRLNPGRNPNEI